MRIQIRYFAVFRERLGREEEEIDLPDGANVAAAIEHLAALHAPVQTLRGRFRVAVNHTMVAESTALRDGDELALIPPVAGGSAPTRHASLCQEIPSLERVIAAVSGPDCGAVVTFVGVVRKHSRGREVVRLEYEAYTEMVEKVFRDLCSELERELRGVRVAIEHRVGTLAVGDVAVVIAASGPHRAEAFQACRAAIDRLKERAPIWKKEVGPSGEEWVGLGP
jgi:molybdopterin synthase catalytic subunit